MFLMGLLPDVLLPRDLLRYRGWGPFGLLEDLKESDSKMLSKLL